MVFFFTHIPFVVNHTINATPPEWLQQLIENMLESSMHRHECINLLCTAQVQMYVHLLCLKN